MNTEWLPVAEYEGSYEVSSDGRVRSLTRKIKHWRGANSIRSGMVLKPADINGYLYVHLSCLGKHKMHAIHRLMAKAFIGKAEGLTVNHLDGKKWNNVLSNLELVTIQDNIRHAFTNNLRSSTGERNPKAKLNSKDVLRIRSLLKSGQSLLSIAEEYGVQKPCVWKIHKRRIWKHL